MSEISIKKEDQILMSLVHYFITEESYSPILVQGVKDEIWLEKLDGPYRVIRINSNKIINDEQFKFDQFKIKDILRQIKKKTMSLTINALNINLNVEDSITNNTFKNIDNLSIKSIEEIEKNKEISKIFPNIKDNLYHDEVGLDLIFNVTRDINAKTENDNKKFEKIFAPKKTIITYILIGICILMYILSLIVGKGMLTNRSLLLLGANNQTLLRMGQLYRVITYAFLHGNIIHLLVNMYSLLMVGPIVENRFGKVRLLAIYLISALFGGLLSAGFGSNISIGASGALFGLLGTLLYFGINFRLYLKKDLVKDIVPVIIVNLILGFSFPGIDNACHIGGLIAGYLAAMAFGIPENAKKKDRINGITLLGIFFIFLVYIAFFR